MTELRIGGGDWKKNQDTEGRTPLHAACAEGRELFVKVILPLSDVNQQTRAGETPLFLACASGRDKCVAELLKASPDTSIPNEDDATPLEVAAEEGYSPCVRLLLEHGGSVRWDHPRSALVRAEKRGHLAVIRALELHKAKTSDDQPGPAGYGTKVSAAVSSPKSRPPIKCRVYKAASRFLQTLHLPDSYFNREYDVCYCVDCHTERGDQDYSKRGNPPKDYGLPIDWVKFGLQAPARAEAQKVFRTWHVAFHGTKVDSVREILKTGELLMPGDVTPDGKRLTPLPNHFNNEDPRNRPPSGHDVSKIYVSPSIHYAGHATYAPRDRWRDPEPAVSYRVRVAFQVRIRPDSYTVGPQTIGAKKQIDPKFFNRELEWSTKRRGVTVLVGLLVNMTGQIHGDTERSDGHCDDTDSERSYDHDHDTYTERSYDDDMGSERSHGHDDDMGSERAHGHDDDTRSERSDGHDDDMGSERSYDDDMGSEGSHGHDDDTGSERSNGHDDDMGSERSDGHDDDTGSERSDGHDDDMGSERSDGHDDDMGSERSDDHDDETDSTGWDGHYDDMSSGRSYGDHDDMSSGWSFGDHDDMSSGRSDGYHDNTDTGRSSYVHHDDTDSERCYGYDHDMGSETSYDHYDTERSDSDHDDTGSTES